MARSLYNLNDINNQNKESTSKPTITSVASAAETQKQYFAILDEFFHRFAGNRAKQFTGDDLIEELKSRAFQSPGSINPNAMQYLCDALSEFYSAHLTEMPRSALAQGGAKMIMGSTQRFPKAAAKAAQRMLLYSDTIIIPDPILPWIEMGRPEERFPIIWTLISAFHLLSLKPVIDADLPYPAILVVPTLDRRLAIESEETQDLMSRSILDFFSGQLESQFEDESEVFGYARAKRDDFLEAVDRKKLFYPPHADGWETVSKALPLYQSYVKQYRSESYQELFSRLSDGEMVVTGILERLEPQFHVRDNADWLRAQPMLWLEPQWHYFKLCAQASESKLKVNSAISDKTMAAIKALYDQRFEWLGNVPIDSLVELRRRNENELFRKKLQEFTSALHDATVDDIDKVACEVSRGLSSLIAEHQNEARRIEEKYRREHKVTASLSWLALAAQFLPWLFSIPPELGAMAPLALAGKYLATKIPECDEHRAASRTLVGVLAAARRD